MTRSTSLNSGAFRFALLIAATFALGFLLIFVVEQHSIRRYADEATAVGLRSELAVLTEEPESDDGELIETIRRRQRAAYEQPFHYLLMSATGRRLAGDLPAESGGLGWGRVRFVDDRPAVGERGDPEVLQSLGRKLPDGSLLVVATDTFDLQNLRRGLASLTAWSGIAVTLLALIGGYVVGLVFLRRLGRVNDAVSRIMSGDLAERLPAIGMSPEFDHLSRNLNMMLERISALMEGLRQVSTDIAHDLRTPLTRLQQRLESMKGSPSPSAYEAGIDAALVQIEELHATFRALLRIGLIEGGESRQALHPVDLSELAGRVTEAYRPVLEDADRPFAIAIQRGTWVLGDPELLALLLTNLIDNALMHTPAGVAISVSLAEEGSGTVVCVADRGPGIPADQRRKVLTRFYRLDASRHTPGAGLGLALASAIAALHRAELLLEGNGPGLKVTLRFPERAGAHGSGPLSERPRS